MNDFFSSPLQLLRIYNLLPRIQVVTAYRQLSTKLRFTFSNLMARKSRRKHSGHGPVGVRHPAQQVSTTGSDGTDAIAKAKTIEGLVAPVLNLPLTATYPLELEISDFVDGLGTTSDLPTQSTAQQQKYFTSETQIQYSYTPVTRSWDQQSQIPQGKYSSQHQTPLSVWENQAPVEEPFNDLGEVAFNYAG
jgi:hypothetical protein